jgi:hypothetical protein
MQRALLSNVVARTVSLGCWGGVETDPIPPVPCALHPLPPAPLSHAASARSSGLSRSRPLYAHPLNLSECQKWVGNFQAGDYGKSAVFTVLGRSDRALVIAKGQAYVIEPETRALIRTFGGEISDVFSLADRGAMIFGNGLWFECTGPEGLRWTTRRISWDGMMEVSLEGERLHGDAFNALDDTWSPFDVDIDTGEVTGGSYPPELPQP